MASLDDVDNSSSVNKTIVEERGHYIDACKKEICVCMYVCMYGAVSLTSILSQVLFAL